MPVARKLMNKLAEYFSFRSRKEVGEDDVLANLAAQEQKNFPFEVLSSATDHFHPSNKLGQGGFGSVYKGTLTDGREIAVKMLSQNSKQGNREFKIEAKLLARAQHKNVVTLLGYCVRDPDKLLVYEFVSNGSLDKLLFNSERKELSWKKRFDIIVGVARGLLYLHEDSHSTIIHRDIKASNILLDDNWVPKVADFGMARLFPDDQTHVNTRVAGTNGYMAPEYVTHGRLSVKADVFSFGVVVLELISGQRNWTFNLDPGSQNLLEWVYKKYKQRKIMEMVDPLLTDPDPDPDQVSHCVQLGLLCTQGDPQLRPTMGRVSFMLLKRPKSMAEPTRPGFPGSRYVRSGKRSGSSSSGGKSEYYSSDTFEASTSVNTATIPVGSTTTSSLVSGRKHDPYGKAPA